MNLPPCVRLEPGPNGLSRLAIAGPLAEATLYLHGAHLAHYQPRGQKPVLWMSRRSVYDAGGANPGKPLRGGVPICYPWFGPRAGDPKAPLHGLVRILPWTLASATQANDGAIELALTLAANDFTRAHWPHEFSAAFRVRLGTSLTMELTIRNAGPAPFTFEQALHTYFAVGDVRQVRISGLEGASYIDKTDNFSRKVQGPEPIAIVAETDRVYQATAAAAVVDDPVWQRRLRIAKEGSATTVVWNPWIAKAKAMPDFGDEEWSEMLCVETANAGDHAVTLAPGQEARMRAEVSVL